MHKLYERPLRLNRVTAVFEDRALFFILAKGATLEELSDRLADLGRHNGCPVAVTVKFGTVKSGASSISSGHLRQSKPWAHAQSSSAAPAAAINRATSSRMQARAIPDRQVTR